MEYKDLFISTDKNTYGMCNKNAEINLTINNPNNYVMNYTLSISDSKLTYTIDGTSSSTYSVIALGTNTHKIVLSGTTSNSNINIIVNATSPYSSSYNKSINLDFVCPVCVFESPTKTTFLNGDTFAYTLTCTDASGIATPTLASSAFTISNSSAFSITSITNTSITNGYKYTINAKAGSFNGEAFISLKEGMVFDKNGNSNASVKSSNIKIENSVIVTFDPNGGNVTTNTKVVNYNSAYGDLPTPTRTGYKFDGWYTSATGGTAVNTTTIVSNSNAHTLYAHWLDIEAPTCTLTLGSSDVYVGNSTTVILKCTDNGSGIATTTLSSGSLTLSNSLGTLSTPTVTSITGGYQYVYTFTANSINGSLTFTLDSGKVKDNADNGNTKITSSALIVKKDLKITYKLNGASSFTYLDKIYTSDTTITLCTLTTNTSCVITLPTITASSITPTIIGWSDAASNHTASYSSGGTANLSSDLTLHAQTRKDSRTYTIKYNTNVQNSDYYSVSVVTPTDTSCTISATYNGTAQASSCNAQLTSSLESGLTVSNWVLMGWATSSSATSGSQPGATISLSSNETRYAIWRKTVSVTFKANGCTANDKTATSYAYNFTKTTSFTVPTVTMNSGWTSLGISSSANTTSQGTSMGSSLSSTIPATGPVVDHYYNCKKDLTIYFTHNSCVADSKIVDKTIYNGATSTSVTVPTATMNSGWTSTGAANKATATSGVAMGSSISFSSIASSTTNLEAFYTCSKVVTVTFKANSCTTTDKSGTITLRNGATSGSVTVPSATMNSGWTSLGASASASSSSGTAMGSSMSISGIGGATTLITRYYNCSKAAKKYTVKFVCSTSNFDDIISKDCTIPTAYNGAAQATSCTITTPDHTSCFVSGWNLIGWGTSRTSHQGPLGDYSVAGDETRYAILYKAPKKLTATFNCNAGSGTQTSTSCTIPAAYYNEGAQASSCNVNLPSTTTCSLSGFNFIGWNTSLEATSGSSGAKSISSNTTYYAIFEKPAIKYTLTYNCNGGSGSPDASTCTIPAVYNGATQKTSCSVNLHPNTACTYSGWSLIGWGKSSSTHEGLATGTIGYSLSGNETRYAIWYKSSKKITATFNCNAGSGTQASTSCTIPGVYNGATQASSCDITLPSTTTCSLSGFNFVGWNTSASSTYGGSGVLSKSSDQTYYAIFEKPAKTLTISYNCNGGSGSVVSSSCKIAAAYNGATQATSCTATLADNGCTYSGWTFNGWGTYNSATSGLSVGANVAISASQTRYATWEKTFTATFKTGSNVTSFNASGSNYCSVYNGDTSCTITLPTIVPKAGYTSVGWGTSTGLSSGNAAGSSYILTGNVTLYANAKDKTAPKCGTITGAGSSSSWAKSRTISIGCSDAGSGCSQESFSKTWDSSATTGYITISDNAGNTANCSVNVYVDTTKPVCGTITGAGNSSEWAKSRTVTVACSDAHSGCVNASFSNSWSSNATTGYVTIKDKAGNTASCPVNVYVDTLGPTCGTITGAGSSSSWTKLRTIAIGCSDAASGCEESSVSQTWSTTTTTSSITLTDKLGNTRSCPVNVYVDTTEPTCGTITGAGSSSSWASSRTVSVACSDSHSGCTNSSFSNTWSSTTTTGYITIKDSVGNTKPCSVGVYVDTTPPVINCSVNSGGSSGVSATVSASDAHSGLATNPSGSKTLTTTTTYTAKDNVGNTKSCTITVTRTISDYIRRYYTCSKPTWNSGKTSWVKNCSASNSSTSNTDSYVTCTRVSDTSTCGSNGQTAPCYVKTSYTRKGCSAYSSSVESTTYPTTCSQSSGTYGKYTCTARYTYSGSV